MRILRKCEVCGEEFIATKITNKYCSKRCARVVHRKKEAEKKKKARESKKDDAQNLQSLSLSEPETSTSQPSHVNLSRRS